MAVTDGPIKVGVIGYGGIGKFHLKGWLALRDQGVNIVGVCDADPAKWSVVEDAYSEAGLPIPSQDGFLYTDCDHFVTHSGVEVVSIALPKVEEVGTCASMKLFLAGFCNDIILKKGAMERAMFVKFFVANACEI